MQKHAAYAVLALACAVTLAMVVALKPATALAGLALAWLLLPYLLLAAAVVIPLGALAFLAYVIYLAPDAQGAIAVLFTPFYQLVAAALLLAICDRLFASS